MSEERENNIGKHFMSTFSKSYNLLYFVIGNDALKLRCFWGGENINYRWGGGGGGGGKTEQNKE
jgi:hypothetical protein